MIKTPKTTDNFWKSFQSKFLGTSKKKMKFAGVPKINVKLYNKGGKVSKKWWHSQTWKTK